jgi:hypothetical protein
VWTAVRDAIMSARNHSTTGKVQLIPLAIPATAERVLRGLSPESFAMWDTQEASGVH